MSTDLALPTSHTPVRATNTSILARPEDVGQAWTIAQRICNTALVPKSFRGKPEETFAAMLRCDELGLPAISGMSMLWATPDGKIGVEARGMVAVVLGKGHDIWTEESNDQRATVCGRRRGSQTIETVTWDIKRAQRAGLAGKSNWKNYPDDMLWARAAATVCRRIAADALAGIGLSAEEMRDEEPEKITRVASKRSEPIEEPERRTITTTATPATQPAPAAAPAWDDIDDAEVIAPEPAVPPSQTDLLDALEQSINAAKTRSDEPLRLATLDGEPIATDAQVRKLSALFNGLKYDDAAVDAEIAELTDGRTTSRKELYRAEASALIDVLDAKARNGAKSD